MGIRTQDVKALDLPIWPTTGSTDGEVLVGYILKFNVPGSLTKSLTVPDGTKDGQRFGIKFPQNSYDPSGLNLVCSGDGGLEDPLTFGIVPSVGPLAPADYQLGTLWVWCWSAADATWYLIERIVGLNIVS